MCFIITVGINLVSHYFLCNYVCNIVMKREQLYNDNKPPYSHISKKHINSTTVKHLTKETT